MKSRFSSRKFVARAFVLLLFGMAVFSLLAMSEPTDSARADPLFGESSGQKGDNDCDGDIDAVDALKTLQNVAGFVHGQAPDCLGIGSIILDGGPLDDFGMPIPLLFGDMDCDFDVDSVDSLLILRVLVKLPINLPFLCEPLGSPI